MCHDHVQMFLANFYDIEGFLFSILLNEQCFYMLLLLILWAKSIVFAILDALCNYAFQVLDARLWPAGLSTGWGGDSCGQGIQVEEELWGGELGWLSSEQVFLKVIRDHVRDIMAKVSSLITFFLPFHISYWQKYVDSSNLQGSFGQGGIFQVQTEFM